ncbi:MAG TPA: GNAT family protein [Streptosporangiaceae bacterium]
MYLPEGQENRSPYLLKAAGYHGPVTPFAATIETARLILRPFNADDFDDLYAYQSRPDLARYLHWEARDRFQARQALEEQCGETTLDAEGKWLTFAVVWREAHRVVGEIGLKWLSQEHRQGEMGFVFNPDYHGRGLATEAAEALLALGFGSFGWHRIIGSCDARNHASARLMERIGMRKEAHFIHRELIKGEWTDELVFAILDQEWKARFSRT